MAERYGNLIGGAWREPASGEWLANVDPASGEVLGEFPNSGPDDAHAAVEAAAAAQPAWASLAAPARGEVLRRAAEVLESRVDQVARNLMREEGKSLPEARGETLRGATILRYYAAETLRPEGEVIPSVGASTWLLTRRVPLGVCALITPWNFPVAIPLWKAAPALAFGNAVVLKPSELAPLTAWHAARCLGDAGLPPGVLNVVFGQGARFGQALATHPAVSAVSFTGSVRTGRQIAAWCAANGKKHQLEMGGKNGAVVLDDADLDQAVTLTVQGAFKSAGEKCTATSRVIVTDGIYDLFVARLVERARGLKVGPGHDPEAFLGPVITAAARDRILHAVRAAESAGIRVACGPVPPDDPVLRRGFYVAPTVLLDVPPDSPIAREEVFGPVLCVMRARDLDHALELLNGVEYGLSASIFTRNLNAALQFAERAEAGMIRINGETAGVEPQAPFGGMKQSSSHSREQGQAAREFYTQVKTISLDRAGG